MSLAPAGAFLQNFSGSLFIDIQLFLNALLTVTFRFSVCWKEIRLIDGELHQIWDEVYKKKFF